MARSPQNGGQTRQYTPNERLSKGQLLASVLATLEQRRDELSSVLPPDVPFTTFHAIANQALRKNPDLLDCEPRSLINAFVAAAYDGLRVDGVEACIVPEWVTPKGGGRKVKQARYMSMYRGMAQQVLRGGMVTAVSADLIYQNDHYRLLSGTQRGVFHEPNLTGDRGEPIAVYNVATFPNGQTDFVYLTKAQVIEIQKESATGWKDGQPAGVWLKHRDEQWKKTAIRRHRKTLPVPAGYVIHDMDAAADFPQFQQSDRLQAPPRPSRAQIPHQPGAHGTPMDLGGGFAEEKGELVDAGGRQGAGEQQQQDRGQTDSGKASTAAELVDMPANDAEWEAWSKGVYAMIANAKDIEKLNAQLEIEQPRIDAYGDKNAMRAKISDRLAELASGGGNGGADGADANQQSSDGVKE